MAALDLDAIEARANAAAAGPWRVSIDDDQIDVWSLTTGALADDMTPEDAEFIAAAREDVPDLVAEVRRLRLALTEAQSR